MTASLTSLSARSVFDSSENMMVVAEIPSVMVELMLWTPSTPETASSIGLVTCASSSAGAAPNSATTTETTGMSAFGSRVIGSFKKLIHPSASIMIENTIAGSGWRIDQAETFSAISALPAGRYRRQTSA